MVLVLDLHQLLSPKCVQITDLSSRSPGCKQHSTTTLADLLCHINVTVSSIPHMLVSDTSAQVDEEVVNMDLISLSNDGFKLQQNSGTQRY